MFYVSKDLNCTETASHILGTDVSLFVYASIDDLEGHSFC